MKKLEKLIVKLLTKALHAYLDYSVQVICDAIQQGALKGTFSEDFAKKISADKMKIIVRIATQSIIKKIAKSSANPVMEHLKPRLGDSGSLLVKGLNVLSKAPNLVTGAVDVAMSKDKTKAAFQTAPGIIVSMIPGIGGVLSMALNIGFSMISKKIYDKLTTVDEAEFDAEKFVNKEIVPEIDRLGSWLKEIMKQVKSGPKIQSDDVIKQIKLFLKKTSPKL